MTDELDAISVNVYADLNQVVQTAAAAEQELNSIVKRARSKQIKFQVGINQDSKAKLEADLEAIVSKERTFEVNIKALPEEQSKESFKTSIQREVNKGEPIKIKTHVELDSKNIESMRKHIKDALSDITVDVKVQGVWDGWRDGGPPDFTINVGGGGGPQPGGSGGGNVVHTEDKRPMAAQTEQPLKQEKAPTKQTSSTVVGGPAGSTRTTTESSTKTTVEEKPAPGTKRLSETAKEDVIPRVPTTAQKPKASPSTAGPAAAVTGVTVDASGIKHVTLEGAYAQGATVLAGRHAGGGGEAVSIGMAERQKRLAVEAEEFAEAAKELMRRFNIGIVKGAAVLDQEGRKTNIDYLDFSKAKVPKKLAPTDIGLLSALGVDDRAKPEQLLAELQAALEDTLDERNLVKYDKPGNKDEVVAGFWDTVLGLPGSRGPAMRPGKGGMSVANVRAWEKLVGGTGISPEQTEVNRLKREAMLEMAGTLEPDQIPKTDEDGSEGMVAGVTRRDANLRKQYNARRDALKERIDAGENLFAPELFQMATFAANPHAKVGTPENPYLDLITGEEVTDATGRYGALNIAQFLEKQLLELYPRQMKTLRGGGTSRNPEVNNLFQQIVGVRSLLGRDPRTGQSQAGRFAEGDLAELEANQKRAESAWTLRKLEEYITLTGKMPPAEIMGANPESQLFMRDFLTTVLKRRQQRARIEKAKRELKEDKPELDNHSIKMPGKTMREEHEAVIEAGLSPLPTPRAGDLTISREQTSAYFAASQNPWFSGFGKFLRDNADELEKKIANARPANRKMRKQKPIDPLDMELRRADIYEELLGGAQGAHADALKAELAEINKMLPTQQTQTQVQKLRAELDALYEPRGEKDPVPTLKQMADKKKAIDLKQAELLEAEADELNEEYKRISQLPESDKREARLRDIEPVIGQKRERAAGLRATYKGEELQEPAAMQALKAFIEGGTLQGVEVPAEPAKKAAPKKTTKAKTTTKKSKAKKEEATPAAQPQPTVADVVMADDDEIEKMANELLGEDFTKKLKEIESGEAPPAQPKVETENERRSRVYFANEQARVKRFGQVRPDKMQAFLENARLYLDRPEPKGFEAAKTLRALESGASPQFESELNIIRGLASTGDHEEALKRIQAIQAEVVEFEKVADQNAGRLYDGDVPADEYAPSKSTAQPKAKGGYATFEEYLQSPGNQQALASGRTTEDELRRVFNKYIGDAGEGPGATVTSDRGERNRLNVATAKSRAAAVETELARITSPQMASGMLRRKTAPVTMAQAEAAQRYLRGERAGTPIGPGSGGGKGLGGGGVVPVRVTNFSELKGMLGVSGGTTGGPSAAMAAGPVVPLERVPASPKTVRKAERLFRGGGIPDDFNPRVLDFLEGDEQPPFDPAQVARESELSRQFIKQREDLLVSRAPTVALGQAFQTLIGGRPEVQIAIRQAKQLETERETRLRRLQRRETEDIPKLQLERSAAEERGDAKGVERAQRGIEKQLVASAFDKTRIEEIEKALPGIKEEFEHINPVMRSFISLTGGAIAGTLLFGGTLQAAQAGIQMLSAAMKPGIDLMTNYGEAAVATSQALGEQLRQGSGRAAGTVAGALFRVGAEPTSPFRSELERAAVVGGGLGALSEERALYQGAVNFRLNPQAGVTFPVGGGPFGLGATNSVLRELKNEIEGIFPTQGPITPPRLFQDPQRDKAILDSINARFEDIGVKLVSAAEAGVDEAAAKDQRTAIGGIRSERDFLANETVAQVFANQLADRGLVLVGAESGKPITGTQFEGALGGEIIEATKKSVDALIESNKRSLQFQSFARRATSEFGREVMNPIQSALTAMAHPRLPLTAGVPGGFLGQMTTPGGPGLFMTGLQSEAALRARERRGRNAILDLVPADQRGEVRGLMSDLTALGQTAAGIQLNLIDRQTEQQLKGVDLNLTIMRRTIGQMTESLDPMLRRFGGASIGAMTARLTQIGRDSAMIGLESNRIQLGISERELNLQEAMSGLGVAGETPAERALRLEATRENIADQRKLLENAEAQQVLQEEAVPLQFKLEDAQIRQQIGDLEKQLDIAVGERELILDSRAAENTLSRINAEIDATLADINTYIQEGQQAWQDGLSFMGEAAQQTAGDFGELAGKVADAFGITVDLKDLLERISDDDYFAPYLKPGTSGTTEGTGTNIGRYATGGLFNVGSTTPMIVGEAGTETVAVLRNPRNYLTQMSSGAAPPQFNFNISGNTVRSEEDLNLLVARITREVQRAIGTETALRGLRVM